MASKTPHPGTGGTFYIPQPIKGTHRIRQRPSKGACWLFMGFVFVKKIKKKKNFFMGFGEEAKAGSGDVLVKTGNTVTGGWVRGAPAGKKAIKSGLQLGHESTI